MSRSQFLRDLLKFSTLGLEMGAAVVIGLLMGVYLDRQFGTRPWLTMVFLGFGFAAAARAVIRAVKAGLLMEEEEKDEEEKG
ncbi:MAG: AtpZ/AtpI family protein [bacterium]|nr:MAG: AtpZ/AtpI family protein [bacterium]